MHEPTAFRVRDGLAAGIPRGTQNGPRFVAPFHGVRTGDARLAAHLAFLPLLAEGERFSHTTAARILGAPLPRLAAEPLHVTGPIGRGQRRGRGVVGHRDAHPARAIHGLPVSEPGRLLVELGSLLGVDDLVAVADHLLLAPRLAEPGRPFAVADELRDGALGKARGAVAARAAVRLARPGVESPMETALRLLLVRAGLPEPICGHRVAGIGWFDLAWPGRRVLGEYDGDWHRTSDAQYEKDIRRFDDATDAGWRVVRVRKAGIARQGRADTIARFRRALEA